MAWNSCQSCFGGPWYTRWSCLVSGYSLWLFSVWTFGACYRRRKWSCIHWIYWWGSTNWATITVMLCIVLWLITYVNQYVVTLDSFYFIFIIHRTISCVVKSCQNWVGVNVMSCFCGWDDDTKFIKFTSVLKFKV